MLNSPCDIGPGPFTGVVLRSDPSEVRHFQDRIGRALRDQLADDHGACGIKLALEEALVNAIKHGNQMDRGKEVRISYRLLPDRFDVSIADEGNGFDPDDVPDPTAAENLERPCGRGLMLMRHYMSEVTFLGCGNCVRMSKVFRDGVNGKNSG
jgi:serine/threonine-protein kinase RsbW